MICFNRSQIYANTTLWLGSLVSGIASQSQHIVITADSADSFKNRLDKFWANEEARDVSTTRQTYLAAVLQDASKF